MTFENLLALGFLPALLTTGRWIQSKLFDQPDYQWDGLSYWTVSILLGLATCLPALIVVAWLGIFHASWIGAVGWLIFALGFLVLPPAPKSRIDASSWFAIAFAIATFLWNANYADENLQGGRDQGVYSNQAMVISRTGSLFSQELFENQFEKKFHHLIRGNQSGGLYFEYDNKRIVFQFAPAYSTLLAQGYGIAGYNGLFSINPLLSSLAGLFLFALLKQVVPGRWALFGLLCFSLNVVQFWNARITLSEILAQTLLIGGLLIANHAWKIGARGGFAIGCGLIALNSAVRIDGFLAVIGVGAAILLLRLSDAESEAARRQSLLRSGAIASIVFAGISLLFIAYSSPTYFKHHSSMIYPLVATSLAMCAIAAISPPRKFIAWTSKRLNHPVTFSLAATLVVAALLYAYFVRPHVEPFALLQEGHPAAGTRTYRENSLVDLGAYLSPLILIMATVGFLLSLRQSMKGAAQLSLLIGVSLVFTILYLYDPSVSPDHIWRMRRFTPMIIPAFIAFAAIGGHRAFSTFRRSIISNSLAWVALAAMLLSHFYTTGYPLAFTKLNNGFAQFTDTIANSIPPGAVLITNVDIPLLGPLQLARDYQVIRGHPNYPPHKEFIPKFAKKLKQSGKNVFMLSSDNQFSDSQLKLGQAFEITVEDTTQQLFPFPIELASITYRAYLVPANDNFLGYSKEEPRIVAGASPILGIKESGLYDSEFNGEQPFRWTGRTANFSIPWIFERKPISATIYIGGAKPGGSNVKLTANSNTIIESRIPESGETLELPLDKFDWNVDRMDLALKVDPWKPAELLQDATDERELGIQLYGIEFRFERDDLLGAIDFGDSPLYGIRESGLYETETIENTQYRWTNGNATFAWSREPSFTPNHLSITLKSAPPQSSAITILWNDVTIFNAAKVETPSTLEIDLPLESAQNPEVELTINSESFVPADLDPTSDDQRKLGIMIGKIHLK